MNRTLDYLLKCAEYHCPCIQGRVFKEKEDIDLSLLLSAGFLVKKNSAPKSIRVWGEIFPLYFDFRAREYYYIDCGDRTSVAPEEIAEYELRFYPFADLLSTTYHCDVPIEERIKNHFWCLGIPEAGTTEIYLARNAGTNPAVENALENLDEGAMVLWFGTIPVPKPRKAKMYRLSDYITVDGKGLRHKDQWPPAINESAESIQIKSDYAFIIKDDFCEIWFQGTGPIKIDALDGVFYIARILRAKGGRLKPREVAPPEKTLDLQKVNPEEIESWSEERPIEIYSKGDLKRIRKENDAVKEQADAEFEKGNIDRGNELMADYQDTVAKISRSTRPGGKSTHTSDPMANIKATIRKARNRVCEKLRKHGHDDLATHFEKYVKVGDECHYDPDKPITWQVYIPRVHK